MSMNLEPDAPSFYRRMLAAMEVERATAFSNVLTRNPARASTVFNVMKHLTGGAGSATQRSGKGGKSGGGLGGQHAGGIKGGGKRKTHAGRKERAPFLSANHLIPLKPTFHYTSHDEPLRQTGGGILIERIIVALLSWAHRSAGDPMRF